MAMTKEERRRVYPNTPFHRPAAFLLICITPPLVVLLGVVTGWYGQ